MNETTAREKPWDHSTLVEQTRELLSEHIEREGLESVIAMTRLPYHWVADFAKGKHSNPHVGRVQYLYEALQGKALL